MDCDKYFNMLITFESHSGASDVGISASWNLFSNHTKKTSLKSVEKCLVNGVREWGVATFLGAPKFLKYFS